MSTVRGVDQSARLLTFGFRIADLMPEIECYIVEPISHLVDL